MKHLVLELRLTPSPSDSMSRPLCPTPCCPCRGRSQPNTQGRMSLLMQLSSTAVYPWGNRDSGGTCSFKHGPHPTLWFSYKPFPQTLTKQGHGFVMLIQWASFSSSHFSKVKGPTPSWDLPCWVVLARGSVEGSWWIEGHPESMYQKRHPWTPLLCIPDWPHYCWYQPPDRLCFWSYFILL